MDDSATYRLGDELGRGALGRVVRVHDEGTGAVLAGKILHRSHHADQRAVARFEAEARLLVGLEHRNLAHVVGLREIAGERVLLMELIDGPSLAEVIANAATPGGSITPERACAIVRGIAAGLGAAHRAGLVHRDLKPANVLLTGEGEPKIVDFGMARATSFAGVEPGAFAIAGTPDYMAPESMDPLAVDARSDLYALGCILHELLTGHPPYSGATAFAVLEAHRDAPIPSKFPDSTPPEVARLVGWLLAKSPADRPQSAQAVERALSGAGPGTALVVRDSRALARAGACPECGAELIAEVAVCLGCGAEQVRLVPGNCSIFITGPGQVGAKIATGPRQRLIDWLRVNPSLGLDPKPLAEKALRLPFVLATGIAEGSARDLCAALGSLGLDAEARRGGRFALPGVRKKAWLLSGRIAAIGATMAWVIFKSIAAFPLIAVGIAAGTLGGGWYLAGRKAALASKPEHAALPPAVGRAGGPAHRRGTGDRRGPPSG